MYYKILLLLLTTNYFSFKKVEEGWDGIKTGFTRPNSLDFNLVVAEPEKSTCC